MPIPWKLLNTEYLVENKWIRLAKRAFLLPNGVFIPDYYIVEKPDASIIVALTPKRKVLIMREFERGVLEIGYRFPAGIIEKNESPLDAAKREFLEEANIEIAQIQQIGILHTDPGWLTSKVFVFLASVDKTEFQMSKDPRELYDMEWIDFDELGERIKYGLVQNILVVAAYHLAQSANNA